MKEKVLWIIGVLLSCIFYYLCLPYFSTNEGLIANIAYSWFVLSIIGICLFVTTFIIALFLPKRLPYSSRFNKVLPIAFIIVHILFLFGLGVYAITTSIDHYEINFTY